LASSTSAAVCSSSIGESCITAGAASAASVRACRAAGRNGYRINGGARGDIQKRLCVSTTATGSGRASPSIIATTTAATGPPHFDLDVVHPGWNIPAGGSRAQCDLSSPRRRREREEQCEQRDCLVYEVMNFHYHWGFFRVLTSQNTVLILKSKLILVKI
jgi:hypothetical protein